MTKLFKTYLVGTLLAGIALMPVLVAAWYSISQAMIYEQMESALEQEHLETITLKNADITWLKKGKEILVNQQPFDVKKTYTKGDSTTITGLYDHKEKALKESIGKLESNEMQTNKQAKINIPVFVFAPTQTEQFSSRNLYILKQSHYISFNEIFRQSNHSKIIAPPPRSVFATRG